MRGLRSSIMSLYEASAIVPGQSFLARDLLRGGEPVLISERTATRTLKEWDQIAALWPVRAGRQEAADRGRYAPRDGAAVHRDMAVRCAAESARAFPSDPSQQ